ncbi:MAG TPA: AMP-binding protein [Thermomicrobiales bacterium]|jgi:long-chain acyl-CoA synthetase
MAKVSGIRVDRLVDRMAAARPHHPALIYGERRWTYSQLLGEMERRATNLRASGMQPGDVVGTNEPISDDALITFLACCRADLPLLHLSVRLAAAEVRPLLLRADVRLLLTADAEPHPACPALSTLALALPGDAVATDPAGAAAAPAMGDRDNTERCILLQSSSGTTGGVPKLVCVPHRQLTWRYPQLFWWDTPEQVIYNTLGGNFPARKWSESLASGSTFVQASTTDIRQMEAEMVRHRATILRVVPALLHGLVAQPKPPPPELVLAFIRSGAAPLTPQLSQRAIARYGAAMIEEYGSSEGGGMIGTPVEGSPAGSIGKPYPGVAARIVDDAGAALPDGAIGELLIQTPGMSLGYLNDPEANARSFRDGWLHTGDLARRDAAGFYYLSGRRALRINVGGYMVSPEEVEAVLEQHPAVREVVILGLADEARSEVVRAIIVPRGAPPPIGELQRFCREYLASYKVPRHWEFRDALPRSALGKVLRHAL